MEQNILREYIKVLKAKGKIKKYTDIAEQLNMGHSSFYNWLSGHYNFGYTKLMQVKSIVK